MKVAKYIYICTVYTRRRRDDAYGQRFMDFILTFVYFFEIINDKTKW